MVLVDTSVWIDFIAGRTSPAVARLDELLERGSPVAITPLVLQEILQGAESEQAFARFSTYFRSQRILLPRHPVDTFASAARLYFDCRRAGITLRSSIDCTIAQIALEHGATLLHNDRDFERIARVATRLRFA